MSSKFPRCGNYYHGLKTSDCLLLKRERGRERIVRYIFASLTQKRANVYMRSTKGISLSLLVKSLSTYWTRMGLRSQMPGKEWEHVIWYSGIWMSWYSGIRWVGILVFGWVGIWGICTFLCTTIFFSIFTQQSG